jgi:hypothetical protein
MITEEKPASGSNPGLDGCQVCEMPVLSDKSPPIFS